VVASSSPPQVLLIGCCEGVHLIDPLFAAVFDETIQITLPSLSQKEQLLAFMVEDIVDHPSSLEVSHAG
jgi:hypothetical protein